MKTIKFYILLFIAFGLLLASCHNIHDGYVSDKHIVPAHDYTYQTTIMVGKMSIPQFHTGHVSERYVLTITKILGNDTISEDFSVGPYTYQCKSIGNYFVDTIPCEVYEPK